MWIKPLSHTARCILGKSQADQLAESGTVSLLLHQVLSLPDRPIISFEPPSTPSSQKSSGGSLVSMH